MEDRLPNTDWDLFMEYQSGKHDPNGASLDPREEMKGIDKTQLAMTTVEQYADLVDVIGYTKASEEMAIALGHYLLHGELNEFEADMIATLAILGKVATFALNENERLRNGIQR